MSYDGFLKQINIYVGSKYKFDPFRENSNVSLQVLHPAGTSKDSDKCDSNKRF